MSYQYILVAVDGSPTSDHAVAQAADLARATGGRVRLLHVMDPITHISGFEPPGIYIQEVLPRLRKEAGIAASVMLSSSVIFIAALLWWQLLVPMGWVLLVLPALVFGHIGWAHGRRALPAPAAAPR